MRKTYSVNVWPSEDWVCEMTFVSSMVMQGSRRNERELVVERSQRRL